MGKKKKRESKGFGFHIWGKLRGQSLEPTSSEKVGKGVAAKESALLHVFHPPQKKAIAQVILNGYNIDQAESLGSLGAMRSFKIIHGDLWDEWDAQTAVILIDEQGQETRVRVAALPSDEESFGLIEFIA